MNAFDHLFKTEDPKDLYRPNSLSEILYNDQTFLNHYPFPEGFNPEQPFYIGTFEKKLVQFNYFQLQNIVLKISEDLKYNNLKRGDTVLLLRLPKTSDLLGTILYLALTTTGIKVFIPSYLHLDNLQEWIKKTDCKALLYSKTEALKVEKERNLFPIKKIENVAKTISIPMYCFYENLHLNKTIESYIYSNRTSSNYQDEIKKIHINKDSSLFYTNYDNETLISYDHNTFIDSCLSWQKSDLFKDYKLGGKRVLFQFSNPFGILSIWKSLWSKQPICFLPLEIMVENPVHAQNLFTRMSPTQLFCGNTIFEIILELIRNYPKFKDECIQNLKSINLTGSSSYKALFSQLQTTFKLNLGNTYTTTENLVTMTTHQEGELNNSDPSSLGNPLPGVMVGLKEFLFDSSKNESFRLLEGCPKLYKLYIHSPISGYKLSPENKIENKIENKKENKKIHWNDTGDLVVYLNNSIQIISREKRDFIKDGLGHKIFYSRFQELYSNLFQSTSHLELYSLKATPGLGIEIYLVDQTLKSYQCKIVKDKTILKSYKKIVENTLEHLKKSLDEIEFRHYFIERFTIIKASAHLIEFIKSTPPSLFLHKNFSNIIEKDFVELKRELNTLLTGPYFKLQEVVLIKREDFYQSSTTRFTSPKRGALLELANLDKAYIRGKGDKLFYKVNHKEKVVLDFVGGFGGNLLGHRHPEIIKEAQKFLKGHEVLLFDQGSARPILGESARELALEVGKYTSGLYVVRFGSTGAEAVEMALAHAFLEREEKIHHIIQEQKRIFGMIAPMQVLQIEKQLKTLIKTRPPKVLALKRSFHGHSLSARTVLANFKKREKFESMTKLESIFINCDELNQINEIVKRETLQATILVLKDGVVVESEMPIMGIIAAIAEPVQGEGGVHIVDPNLLLQLENYDFPLILDEIQSGLGRCGSFLASEGVNGNYYLFSKALGGGVAKISALLIEKDRYIDQFDELYSSTFSGDIFSAKIMRKTLEIIKRDGVSELCKDKGLYIKKELLKLWENYPDVFSEVRGIGLLQAIELNTECAKDSILFRAFREREFYGIVVSGFLLNNYNIRILPTLSAPNTLRIEPSAYIEKRDLLKLFKALNSFAKIMRSKEYSKIIKYLIDYQIEDSPPVTKGKEKIILSEDSVDTTNIFTVSKKIPLFPKSAKYPTTIEDPDPDAIKVGFINHFAFPEQELLLAEPSLKKFSFDERRVLFEKMVHFCELRPFISFAKNILKKRVWFLSIVIPADAALLGNLYHSGQHHLVTERIQEGVDLAAKFGCKAIALGGYTSIMTQDGKGILSPPGVKLTSGNTFTGVVGVRRILEACKEYQISPSQNNCRIAIVGATGNIGQILTKQLLLEKNRFKKALLVARDERKLQELKETILEFDKRSRGMKNDEDLLTLEITSDINLIKDCNVIAIATNSNEPLIYPHHIGHDKNILIADLSVPSAVSSKVWSMKNVKVISLFGTVEVPDENDFIISSHTKPGTTFCCSAEVMILGLELEKTKNLNLVGTIDIESSKVLEQIGDEYGFLKKFGEGGFKV